MEILQRALVIADGRLRSFPARLYIIYPGILAVGTAGLAATWMSQQYSAPVMLFALLFGIAFHFLYEEGRCSPGIDFCSKLVLRTGVALLGARITVDRIMHLGSLPILMVVVGVATTIGFGIVMTKMLRMRSSVGILSGGAVGICGASAALAIASVLPHSDEKERETVFTVVVVTAFSGIAMILYPLIVPAIGLNHSQAGVFLGTTIHDVAQVVGAGYSISPETGDIATYVKLLRVAMLLPVVSVISLSVRRRTISVGTARGASIPLFLLGFAALVLISSAGFLTGAMIDKMSDLSQWCLVSAVAAIGMKTSFKNVIAVGWKPVILIVGETVWIASLALTAIHLFG